MMAEVESQLEKMEACLGKTATYLEANPEEKESVMVHEEVPKEEAAVETFGALKERYRDRHLALRRRGQERNGPRAVVGPGRSWPSPAIR
jgi:hypothetical protein